MDRQPLVTDEIYHVFNRGVDKREIFLEKADVNRFLRSMLEFNDKEPIGSILENNLKKKANKDRKKIVEILCYCLNPNHYHLLLKQLKDGGISEFMKRLSGGYTWAFNKKYARSGALFQGRFKSKHVDDNNYLLHLSAYINLNHQVHQFGGSTAKLVRSSWEEYLGLKPGMCENKIIMDQFKNIKEYEDFARESIKETIATRAENKLLDSILIE